MRTKITNGLTVDGPDSDGDYELMVNGGLVLDDYTYINRREADALIMALCVRDASGRFIAPAQAELPKRPAGPWDGNGKV